VSEGRTAALIAAGTELTEGIIQDTHARFLSSELTAMGFTVVRSLQVPDSAELFAGELARAARDARLVVITGGLGPTSDDLTREIVAEAAGARLEFHEEVWAALRERFKGRPLAESNRKQAMAPHGFALIPNPNGTAPGFWGPVGGSLVVALPGPPLELRPMWSASVVPLLAGRFAVRGGGEILWGTALLVPESGLEEALRAVRREGVSWGTRVDEDRIVFSLRGASPSDRERVLAELAGRLGETRIRSGDRKPAELLTEALTAAGKRLVTAESCTGGLLGKWMTDLPGSSRVYWGGVVAYSNEAKAALLGVEPGLLEAAGAVSEAAVRAMAAGALKRSGADLSIAVSGVAGPEGGTVEKPVGTVWTAVAESTGLVDVRPFSFSGSRDMIRRRTAVSSFLLAEARLRGKDFLDTLAKW
jgi:nicotinamide-nucleotide amidase